MTHDNDEITLEVCSCTEWLRENAGLPLEQIANGYEDEAANTLAAELHWALEGAGYHTVSATGQRRDYHGWNGANLFTHKLRAVATFDPLTPAQLAQIEVLYDQALESATAEYPRDLAAEFAADIEAALGAYCCTPANPCGGVGYYDAGEPLPYRVLYADGAECERFATADEAIAAAAAYAADCDADASSEAEPAARPPAPKINRRDSP